MSFPLRVFPEAVTVEVELDGVGNGWTELPDVQINTNIEIRRGISGTGPLDLLAGTGTMTFQLNNAANNSAGLEGLYSLRHANALDGWKTGIGIRAFLLYGSVPRYVFVGTIKSIEPMPGKHKERKVSVTCVDWMDEAARTKVRGLATETDKRSDEVFSELLAIVDRQPASTAIQYGADEYPYVFDNALSEKNTVYSEFQRLCQSEFSRAFVKGDGTLVYESRHKRPNSLSVAVTLTGDDIGGITTQRGNEAIVNRVEVQAHPRRVDVTNSVLFTLASIPKIEAGTSYSFSAPYRDPDARATRVGGMSMVTPVATTDYTAFENQDGTGSDLTSSVDADIVFGANSAEVTVTNAGSQDLYLCSFQLRGLGVYDYETVLAVADDEDSQAEYGESVLSVDMPYQDDPRIAKDAADYLVSQLSDVISPVTEVEFVANREDRLMLAALTLDVSDRVHVEDDMVGTEPFVPVGEIEEITALEFFINSVQLSIGERGIMRCKWGLTPADPFKYWILERDGFTELGETTRLAYGAFIPGWQLDNSALGTDTRVNS